MELKKDWEIKKLGELCKYIGDGDWIESGDQSTEGIRLVQTGNIGTGIYLDKENKAHYISEETFVRLKCTEIFPGDCLISRLPDPVGRACIIPDLNQKMITAVDCTIIRFKENIQQQYFVYYSQSNKYLADIDSESTGATRKRISRKNLEKINIPVPPLEQQKRIVKILDEKFTQLGTIKANTQTNLQNAKDLFQSQLTKAFSNTTWEMQKLSEITEVKDGTHDSPSYYSEGIPFVTQKNITSSGFDLTNTKRISLQDHEKFYKRSNVEYGDIIIAMIGANRGMSCIVNTREVFSIKNVGLIKKSEKINQEYLAYYLKSEAAQKYVSDASNGGAQEFIGLTSLRNFPIPLPPLPEQKRIVKELDTLSEKVHQLQEIYTKQISDCDELKQSLLAKAFEGNL